MYDCQFGRDSQWQAEKSLWNIYLWLILMPTSICIYGRHFYGIEFQHLYS